MLKALKSVCSNCSAETIKTYARNIKRAYIIGGGDGDVPVSTTWVKKSLENIKEKPVGVRRHLSIAIVKFLKGVKGPKKLLETASEQMEEDAVKYKKKRGTNKWSTTEKAKRPVKGIKALTDAAKEMGTIVRRLIKHEDEPSLTTLYKYQAWLLLQLYTEVPLRNTWATFKLKDVDGANYLKTGRGKFKLYIRSHKNVKKTGVVELDLDRKTTMRIRKFLAYRKKVAPSNDALFNTLRGTPMSRGALSKFLHKTTKNLLGKGFGSRLIRVLAATAKAKEIEASSKLAENMLHSAEQQKTYVRKD